MNKSKSFNRRLWLLILFSGLLLGLILIRASLPYLGLWLVKSETPRPADAIIPLAGDGSRVRYAASLYHQEYAGWLVVTNQPIDIPGIDEPYVDLARRELLHQDVPETRIVTIDQLIKSTKEEALAIRSLAENRAWKNLIIVTSPYHTRRSHVIFHQVLSGSDIEVQVVAVQPDPYDARHWWQDVASLRATALEYMKFLSHWAGYH